MLIATRDTYPLSNQFYLVGMHAMLLLEPLLQLVEVPFLLVVSVLFGVGLLQFGEDRSVECVEGPPVGQHCFGHVQQAAEPGYPPCGATIVAFRQDLSGHLHGGGEHGPVVVEPVVPKQLVEIGRFAVVCQPSSHPFSNLLSVVLLFSLGVGQAVDCAGDFGQEAIGIGGVRAEGVLADVPVSLPYGLANPTLVGFSDRQLQNLVVGRRPAIRRNS